MDNIWLFGATKFQGNPKFLFLYLNHERLDINAIWVADTQEQARYIKNLGYQAVVMGSDAANKFFEVADYYIVENFRESLPDSINPDIVIANLWHGVGLKHIEFGLDSTSPLTDSVVRKNVRNFTFFKNNLLFLAPSVFMEEHFIEEMKLESRQIIRGAYPRNIIGSSKLYSTFDHSIIGGKNLSNYAEIVLFAPTYRDSYEKVSLFSLFADIPRLQQYLLRNNVLFIFKMHHFEEKSKDYIEFRKQNISFDNFMFWDDQNDIYEIFDQITTAIVDYSSIYYDLLQAGVSKFIRYVPDFESYSASRGLKFDYLTYTDGAIAHSFEELISALEENEGKLSNRQFIEDCFFGYSDKEISPQKQMNYLVEKIEQFEIKKKEWKKLYSFDVFDTLICRSTVEPVSIFYAVQAKLHQSDLNFSEYFIQNYPKIRREVEADLRDIYRKTTFERNSDTLEITFSAIFNRLANIFSLSDTQIDFLECMEISCELDAVRPITARINFLLSLVEEGHDVILVSDMYLPKEVVNQLILKADPRLSPFKLYLSSEIGDQKSTGKLYKHIFFDLDYQYSEWIHFGDNHHADGAVPRKFGIKTINHALHPFTPYELSIKNAMDSYNGYVLASMMYQKRISCINEIDMSFDFDGYYAYAYIGAFFIPYVTWLIEDATKRGYETLYFISRDGYYLKDIADQIIEFKKINIKTKYIYGSRKAWRLPAQINQIDEEFFQPFGLLANAHSFEEVVAASLLSKDELLEVIPELVNFQYLNVIEGSTSEEIRQLFKKSKEYHTKLLEIAVEKRKNVLLYLNQTIDFNEKFAFIEFWGRGYTQDLLTRLLQEAAQSEIKNPFYYMRSFNLSQGNSIRHIYTQVPINFTFIEPIFASTPYESIPGYQLQENGEVTAIIRYTDNECANVIKKSLHEFTRDYLEYQIDTDPTDSGRALSHIAFDYHLKNPHDQYINKSYSNFDYNAASYGSLRKIAMELTTDILKQFTLKELGKFVSNVPMSLSKSSEAVRQQYLQKCKIEKVKPIVTQPVNKTFPANNLSKYLCLNAETKKIILLQNHLIYSSTEFIEKFKLPKVLNKGLIVEVIAIVWSKAGVPRLLTQDGFLSAHKSLSRVINTLLDQRVIFEEKYLKKVNANEYLMAVSDLIVYSQPTLIKKNMTKQVISKGHLFTANQIVWGHQNTPCLQVYGGYVSACLDCVTTYSEATELVNTKQGIDIMLVNSATVFKDNVLTQKNATLDKGSILKKIKPILKNNKAILAVPGGFIELKAKNFQRVRADIENYHVSLDKGWLKTLGAVKIYNDINFKQLNQNKPRLKKGQILQPIRVDWTEKGTPRFVIEDGYITTNKNSIACVSKSIINQILRRIK